MNLLAQEPALLALEQQFAQTDTSITQFTRSRAALVKQAEAQAREIQELKSKDHLNYFQRQRLEGLLKDSQVLSNRIEALDTQLRTLNNDFDKIGMKLSERYDAEIKRRLNILETKKLPDAVRQAEAQELEHLRVRHELIKQKLGSVDLSQFKIVRVQIEPDDTPKQVEQKADLLKDQEEKLRRLAAQINKQSKQLKREMELQNRINDLVTDIGVFDQQEEALSNVDDLARAENPGATSTGSFEDQVRAIEKNLLVGQRDFDFSTLSSEQVEELLANLNQRELQFKAQADSLARQAEAFYKAAQDMKKL
jgi:chromosome segregation ATPase